MIEAERMLELIEQGETIYMIQKGIDYGLDFNNIFTKSLNSQYFEYSVNKDKLFETGTEDKNSDYSKHYKLEDLYENVDDLLKDLKKILLHGYKGAIKGK